ncbi:MAG TPA: protein kinase [Polyangiaceae bacterium]
MNVGEYLAAERARTRVGTILREKYRLDELLGIGGTAAVYGATHRNKKRFAIKILHAELSLLTEIRHRFLREGYVANSVNHPGAVAVLDDDVLDDGSAFLVMELLDGATVAALAKDRGGLLPLGQVLAIADALLDTLDAADTRSVVHRDVKPANLLVTRTGELKVLDFGIGRLQGAPDSIHTAGEPAAMGTPGYLAPEQALGRAREITGRTDVWGAGATLFALLSARPVHCAASVQEQVIHAATRPAPALAEVAPWVPPAVCAIVDRALAFDASERWARAGDMRAAVRAAWAEIGGGSSLQGELAALGRSSGGVPAGSRGVWIDPAPTADSPGSARGPLDDAALAAAFDPTTTVKDSPEGPPSSEGVSFSAAGSPRPSLPWASRALAVLGVLLVANVAAVAALWLGRGEAPLRDTALSPAGTSAAHRMPLPECRQVPQLMAPRPRPDAGASP